MRDLYERGGFVSPIHRAAVMKAHDDLIAAPAEPADGQNGVGRSTVYAGAAEGAERASGSISEAMSVLTDPDDPTLEAVETIYATAQRVMASAGPLLLASSEPWMEGDEAYRARLTREAAKAPFCTDVYCDELQLRSGYRLDSAGVVLGLPRARLVPVASRILEDPHP